MSKHYHIVHGDIEATGVQPDLFRSEDLEQAISFYFAHAVRYVNTLEEVFPGEALDVRSEIEELFSYVNHPSNRTQVEEDGLVIYTDNNEAAICLFPCDMIDCEAPILKGEVDGNI
jgi:hypothetical protein